MELCNKFDAVFIKNAVFEDVFMNENLFNKKCIVIRRKLEAKMRKIWCDLKNILKNFSEILTGKTAQWCGL